MALPLHHHQDRYRSAPGTPYIDPRSISAHDMETAFQQARFGLGGADYFPDSPRFDGVPMPLRPRSPYTQGVGRFDSEFGGSRDFEVSLSEHIRKTNLAVALANSQISSRAKFSLLHPMVASDGRFSEDFNVPKTVESVKLFDSRLAHTARVDPGLILTEYRHATRPCASILQITLRQALAARWR